MAYLRTLFFAGLGALLLIVFAPQTGWIFRNHVDLISSHFPPDNNMRKRGSMYSVGNPMIQGLDAPGSKHEFALATLEAAGLLNSESGAPYARRLTTYCFHHPKDAAGWGTLVRYLSMHAPSQTVGEMKKTNRAHLTPAYLRSRASDLEALVRATEGGMKADPKNAFFPMIKAACLSVAEDIRGAKAALAQAGKCPRYQDYTRAEPDAVVQAVRDQYGFRGHAFEATVYGYTMFGHASRLRRLPLLVWENGLCDQAAQADVVHCAGLMIRSSESRILMFVARTIFDRALIAVDDKPTSMVAKPTLDQITASISTNMTGSAAREAGELSRTFDLVGKQISQMGDSNAEAESTFELNAYIQPKTPTFAMALLALFIPGALLMLCVARGKTYLPTVVNLAPRLRTFLAAVAGIAGVLGLTMIATQLASVGENGMGYPGLVVFLVAAALMPAAKLKFLALAAPLCVLASALYLTVVVGELRSDEVMSQMLRKMDNEAAEARRSIGLSPQSAASSS